MSPPPNTRFGAGCVQCHPQACVLVAWPCGGGCPLPARAMGLGAPIPAAPAGDGTGDGEHGGSSATAATAATAATEPQHGPGLCPVEAGCGLGAVQGSGTAGRNLVCGCRRPSERHGVARHAPARGGKVLPPGGGEAARGCRGTGTPARSLCGRGRRGASLLRWALTGSLCLLLPCSEFPGAFKEVLELPASGSHRGLLPEGVSPHLPLRVCRRHR